MNDKVFVKLIVPEIDQQFDVYLPINRKIGNIIILLNETISEASLGEFAKSESNLLFNVDTHEKYNPDALLASTNIRNGSRLVLLS